MPYCDNVFINCPFDSAYDPLRRAIVFTVLDCGFTPRSTLETTNGQNYRFENIKKIIKESQYGIHDISRTELDAVHALPRFNMPLELGVFIGAASFGTGQHKQKNSLILDKEPHRYQKFISDIAGQDIQSHDNSERNIIERVRTWLSNEARMRIPGGKHLADRYELFKAELPALCDSLKLEEQKLTFAEYALIVARWTKAHGLPRQKLIAGAQPKL
jgi:hypothetical protein